MTENPTGNTCENLFSCNGRWLWVALLVIILFASAVRIRLLDVPLERDEGEYAYAGQMLLHGFLPYEPPSLYKYKLPGIYFLYAIVLFVFGQTISAVHLGLLVANLATILLLFFLAKKLFGFFAAVAAAAFYAVISLSTSVLGLFAHAEHFVALAAVAGILLLLNCLDNYRWWKLFLSGLLLGCAYLIRQHGAAFILVGAVYLFQNILKADRRWSENIRRLAVFCAGAACPFLLTCLVFLLAGSFGKFWFWTFIHAREYAEFMPFSIGMELLTENMTHIVISSVLIWLLALLGLIVVFVNRQLLAHRFFVTTFFIFSFLSVCPGMYFRSHYFVTLLPAAALLAALGATQIKDFLLRNQRPSVSGITAGLAVLVAFVHAVYYEHNTFFNLSPASVSRLTYGTNPFPESLEIARYIKEHSDPADTVAVLGSEPQILFYAGRRSPTGYTDTYEMMSSTPGALAMQKEMIHEIELAAPKFIVFVRSYMSWLPEPNSYNEIFDWFEQYQQKYYTQVGIVDIPVTAPTVYLWNEQAINYKPHSKNWVAIFERKG